MREINNGPYQTTFENYEGDGIGSYLDSIKSGKKSKKEKYDFRMNVKTGGFIDVNDAGLQKDSLKGIIYIHTSDCSPKINQKLKDLTNKRDSIARGDLFSITKLVNSGFTLEKNKLEDLLK